MNILRRIYERLVDIVTRTELVEFESLSEEEQDVLGQIAELSGVKPSTIMRVILAEALIKEEGFERIKAIAESRARSDVSP